MVINKNKILFVCTEEIKQLCNGCIYRYPQLIAHTTCIFFELDIGKCINSNMLYRADFGMAGKSKSNECKPHIKFMKL